MKKKVLVVCSGGLDSTVLYHKLQAEGNEVTPINFSYGSKHNQRERQSAREIFGDKLIEIDIDLSFLKGSSLINRDIEVPKGHYEDETMKSTVVPFRNGIMLAYATAYAEDNGFDAVALGSHFGDHAIYPDCRESFSKAMKEAIKEGTYNNIELLTPFSNIRKEDIVKIGAELDILDIMAKTYSCYEGKEKHCGKCGTCVERKEAFELAGVEDPTEYQE